MKTISLPEAAQRLGLSHQAAYNLCLRGLLPARKVGTRWQVSVEAVEKRAAKDGL